MTTEGGLVRFDGQNFETISASTDSTIVSDRMRYLVRSARGELYATDAHRSLYRIVGPDVLRVVDGRTLGTTGISLACSFTSVARYPEMIASALADPTVGDHRVHGYRSVTFDSLHWAVLTPAGIALYNGAQRSTTVPVHAAVDMSFALNGAMYVLDQEHVLYHFDPEAGRLRPRATHNLPHTILSFFWNAGTGDAFALGNDTLWSVVGGSGGIRFDPLLTGLPMGAPVLSVATADDGRTVFIGTANKGLYRYKKHRMHVRSGATDQLTAESASYYAVLAISDSSVLVYNGWELGEQHLRKNDLIQAPVDRFVLHRDPSGRVWTSTDDNLLILGPAPFDDPLVLGSPVGRISTFLQEGDTTWAGGLHGVVAFVEDRPVVHIPIAPSSALHSIYSMCRAADGRIWLATSTGVWALDEGGRKADLLVQTRDLYARALHRDGERMFVGTYGQGVHLHDGNRWHRLPFDPKRGCTHVHGFIADTLGWIWMPTNNGLFRMQSASVDRWLADPSGVIDLASHGEEEGLATAEFNGGCTPAYVRFDNGRVVLPSMDGLVWFTPEEMPYPWPQGPVDLDRITLDGVDLAIGVPLPEFSSGSRLEVKVSLPFWGHPRNMLWQYSLIGQGTRLPIGADGNIVVERLPSGTHELQVFLPGSAPQTLLRLVVRSPWYLRWWALLGFAACLVLIGMGASRWRFRRIMNANLELERQVDQRTAQLRLRNEELRRESNVRELLVRTLSHDIVAPLKAVARLGKQGGPRGEVWSEEELRATYADMAEATDRLHEGASNLLEWIKRQGGRVQVQHQFVALHDHVEAVFAVLRETARQQGMRLTNRVLEDLLVKTDPQLITIILQNVISNALRHGQGTEVRITAEGNERHFRIEVQDDGPGMSAAALERIHTLLVGEGRDVELRSGLGYMIIADMATLLEAHVAVRSAPGQGTQVLISVGPEHP
jgi:signal transduction histidine kinase